MQTLDASNVVISRASAMPPCTVLLVSLLSSGAIRRHGRRGTGPDRCGWAAMEPGSVSERSEHLMM